LSSILLQLQLNSTENTGKQNSFTDWIWSGYLI